MLLIQLVPLSTFQDDVYWDSHGYKKIPLFPRVLLRDRYEINIHSTVFEYSMNVLGNSIFLDKLLGYLPKDIHLILPQDGMLDY